MTQPLSMSARMPSRTVWISRSSVNECAIYLIKTPEDVARSLFSCEHHHRSTRSFVQFVFNAQNNAERRGIRPSRGFPGLDHFPGIMSDDPPEGQGLLERM